MVKRRQAGDPWYTALYREPHTLWWVPPLFTFVLLFAFVLAVYHSPGRRSLWR